MSRLFVGSFVLLAFCLMSGQALKCYWCVGVHCLHPGSGEQIECDGSCLSMMAKLEDGLSRNLLQKAV